MPNGKAKMIYLRIRGLAVTDDGKPDDAYAQLEIPAGIADMLPGEYSELVKKTNPVKIMAAFGLENIARDHVCEIITPAEYRDAMIEDQS